MIATDASAEVSYAAEELQKLIEEATGETFPIVRGNSGASKVISLGDTNYAETAGVTVDKDNFDYGYTIKTVGGSIFITAPTDYGVTFGVYGFLERQFNYECFSDEVYTIDKVDEFLLPDEGYDVLVKDDFSVRFATPYSDGEGMRAMGYVTRKETAMTSGSQHNTLHLIKPADYMAEHPKWFYKPSTSHEQLCYTAQGDAAEYQALVQVAAEKLENYFMSKPDDYFIYLSMEDNTVEWCDCHTCRQWESIYGSNSAAVIRFTNDVAAAIDAWMETNAGKPYARDYKIGYLAYAQMVEPPFKALSWNETAQTYSVNTSFKGSVKWDCSTHSDGHYLDYSYENVIPSKHTLPIYASPAMKVQYSIYHERNAEHLKQIRGWQALTQSSGMGVWSYFVNYTNYWLYYDSYESMAELYSLFAEGNIKWFIEESVGSVWGALRNYLSANLAKDASQDITELTERFCANYYGAAGEAMLKVFNDTRTQFQSIRDTYTESEGSDTNSSVFVTIDMAEYWSYEFAKAALDTINEVLETEGLTQQQILNIRAERLSYEYMLIEYYDFMFEDNELLALKLQAKADAVDNGITKIASSNRNGKYISTSNAALNGTTALVWERWGV